MENNDDVFEQRSPIVRREIVAFAQHVDLGAGQREHIRFQRTIIWLRDEGSQWQMLLDGERVKEGSSFNDFYGPGSSITEAIKEAEPVVRKHKAATVEIVTTMKEFACIQAKKKPFYEKAVPYHSLPHWIVADEAYDRWLDAGQPDWYGEHGVRTARDLSVEEEIVVWRNGAMTPEGVALMAKRQQDKAALLGVKADA